MYYLQTRYYDPTIGQFISPDSPEYLNPEDVAGLNLYAYCGFNPVMYADPTGHFAISAFVVSLIIGAVVGAAVAAATSATIQLSTTGKLSLAQMGISALFGAVTGVLSLTGIGGVIGQFFIQGALAVGELYSIAALDGDVSSIGVEEIVATFLLSGALGAIGSKGAAAEFKRIG